MQVPDNNVNILFYSANCKFCYNLMNLLNNLGVLKTFRLIKTDNNPNLPAQITAVPTLIIAGYKKMLVCDEAFKWVNNLILIKQNEQNQNKNNINMNAELNNAVSDADNIAAMERLNFSDLFTFVDNNNLPQNNEFTDPNKKQNYIFTAPELGKMDKETQIKEVNSIIAKRTAQDKYSKELIKQPVVDVPDKKKNYY
jgi:hypothetical protein